MASSEKAKKGNLAERGLLWLRNLHIGIGAVALAGAVVFPQIVVLPAVAAYEGASAVVHDELSKAAGGKRKSKSKTTHA